MEIYNLDKTSNLDTQGRILNSYIHTNLKNVSTIKISDGGGNSLATIENISNLFTNLSNIKNIDISEMNLQNVQIAEQLFYNCQNLTNVKLSDMNNVKTGYRMFEKCYNLSSIELPNMINCNNYRAMFSSCNNLINPPIDYNSFKNDTSYRYLYGNCFNLQVGDIHDLTLNNCDLSSIYQYKKEGSNVYNLRFTNCSNIGMFFCNTQPIINDNNDFKIMNNCYFENIRESYRAFTKHDEFNKISNITCLNSKANQLFSAMKNVISMENLLFKNCSSVAYLLSWSPNLREFENIIFENINELTGLCENSYNITNVVNITFTNCINFVETFTNCINLSDVGMIDMQYCNYAWHMFHNCNNLSSRAYENIANFLPNANQLTNDTLESIGLNINNFNQDSYNILKEKGYFETQLENLSNYYNIYNADNGSWLNIDKLDYDSQANILRNLFEMNNSSHIETTNIKIQDASGKSISQLTNIAELFYDTSYSLDDKTFSLKNLKYIDMSNLITNRVTNITRTFGDLKYLTEVTAFNTDRVTNCEALFIGCHNLKHVPDFNFSSLNRSAYSMFRDCYNLENSINLNFNTKLVVTGTDFMFMNCYKLVNINVNNLSTNNGESMFKNCNRLTYVSNFSIFSNNSSQYRSLNNMFMNCTNLVSLPILNVDTVTILYMDNFASNCINLINVPEIIGPHITIMNSAFSRCNNLSNNSIQNIINMCLNSNMSYYRKNLNIMNSYSPFYNTNITSDRYSNRLTELTEAGWTY